MRVEDEEALLEAAAPLSQMTQVKIEGVKKPTLPRPGPHLVPNSRYNVINGVPHLWNQPNFGSGARLEPINLANSACELGNMFDDCSDEESDY